MTGAVGACQEVQLAGNLSLWLTIAPECTFFQQEYCRHSAFATAEADVAPSSAVRWGGTLQYEIPRQGDLLGECFHRLVIRGVRFAPGAVTDPATAHISWVNGLGWACHRKVYLEIGQIPVDSMSGRLMQIIDDLSTPLGNEADAMVGEFRDGGDLRDWSFYNQVMHVPLRFHFFGHTELYLPLIALSSHPVRIKCQLYSKAELINASDSSNNCVDPLTVLDTDYDGTLVDASIVTRSVFLDQYERNLISAETIELVFDEHQEDACEPIQAGTTTRSKTLSFNNAVMVLLSWFVQDKDTSPVLLGNPNCNKEYHNYRVPREATNIPPWLAGSTPPQVCPFATWQVRYNGADRVAPRESEYFTDVLPYLAAVKKTRSRGVMIYPFHLAPFTDNHIPAGHAMFSRIHEIKSTVVFRQQDSGGSILTPLDPDNIAGTVGDGEWCTACKSQNVGRFSMGQYLKKFH
jgi:hypothetical protein